MLSALRTGRLYPSANIPGTHFCWRQSRPQGYSAAGRITSMKNSNDTIGNGTRDLPACSRAVPQQTAPQHTSTYRKLNHKIPNTSHDTQKIIKIPQLIYKTLIYFILLGDKIFSQKFVSLTFSQLSTIDT